jgi:1-acyl-sn-glycerol-3-phosphate acyltransferase
MRKALKNLIILPLAWSSLALLGSFLFLISFLPKTFGGRYYHYLGRLWCRLFVNGLDVDLKLVHRNSKPLPDHYILIANHPSAFEDFALPALFDIYPLAKNGVRHWFLLGRISEFAGVIFVERNDADSRYLALQSLVEAARLGKNMAIFPEGGCKGRHIYERFHTGAFEVSLRTGLPVLPVYLHYIDQDTFEWTKQTLLQKLWQIFRSDNNQVFYYVHDVLDPSQFSDKQQYAEYAHDLFLRWQALYNDTE